MLAPQTVYLPYRGHFHSLPSLVLFGGIHYPLDDFSQPSIPDVSFFYQVPYSLEYPYSCVVTLSVFLPLPGHHP